MILEKIQDDLKNALKKQDDLTVSTLRFLLASIKNKEIELKKRGQLTDEEVIRVIRKQAKQRQESIDAYQKAAREDLADKEIRELKVLSKYLPQQKSPQELEKTVEEVIKKVGASGPKDFGQVMGQVMAQLKGQADGKVISDLVKQKLQ